jgi:hypothetical protein
MSLMLFTDLIIRTPGNPEPGENPGRSRRCNRGRRRVRRLAGHCRGLIKNPGGKADLLRLIREPEDLPGGFFVFFVSEATPDGKGSSIDKMGLFFLWFSVFSFRFSVKAKSSYHIGTKAIEKTPTSICGDKVPSTSFFNRKLKTGNRKPHFRAYPRRSRFSADPGKPPEEGGHVYGKI